MNNYTVYMHKNIINDKIYIGITIQNVNKRWLNGKGYTNNDYFNKAIQKYGWDNFEHIILYENLTKEEAEQKEIELIAQYKSNQRDYGYNIANGGNHQGKHSEETKKKISKAKLGKSSWNKGKNIGIGKDNGFYGHHHTEITKKKISEANKGRKMSIETKQKISIASKKMWKRLKEEGYSVPDEVRRRTAERMKGNKYTLGYHHTKEAKEKMRLAKLGKHNTKVIEMLANLNKKPIICYNKNMEFIAEFESIKKAGEILKIFPSNISRCLKYSNVSARGYKFKYKENNDE